MNNQRILTKLFIEELRKRNALSDVIYNYEIENIRECDHCHKLINEGIVYEGLGNYCSVKCLLSVYPEVKEEAYSPVDDDSYVYWTSWEG